MRNLRLKTPGMTLMELLIAIIMFSILSLVAFTALASARRFTDTNQSEVDLQESARRALEKVAEEIRNSGSATISGRIYPKLYRTHDGGGSVVPFPSGYNISSAVTGTNAPKHPAKGKAGPPYVNGGDPTLPSDNMIFLKPKFIGTSARMPDMNPTTNVVKWDSTDSAGTNLIEYGIFIVPGLDTVNQLELRRSDQIGNGAVLCRYVDRVQIQTNGALDPTRGTIPGAVDPTLTNRQIRITLYLSRVVAQRGVLSNSAEYAQSVLTVSISTIVDMRNSAWQ